MTAILISLVVLMGMLAMGLTLFLPNQAEKKTIATHLFILMMFFVLVGEIAYICFRLSQQWRGE